VRGPIAAGPRRRRPRFPASQRDDGLGVLIDAHPSVARTIAALLRSHLLAELIVQRRQPHWRQDENGRPHVARLVRISFLAPDIVAGVLADDIRFDHQQVDGRHALSARLAGQRERPRAV
jgi:hypothetical protein